MTKQSRALALPLLLAALAIPASASDLGPVIVVRGGANPLLLWNATTFVASLVTAHNTGDAGLANLEATALKQLSDKVKSAKLARGKRITLKVTYLKTGAVSPVYGGATFAGVEEVFTISAPGAKLTSDAGVERWQDEITKGHVPDGVSVSVIGKLPPS